ncbi:MAG: TonB-dependent receptor domain-containing protein [Deltaproteobacteria bacterium]
MKMKILYILFLAVVSIPLTAQNLNGRILDNKTKEPVVEAKVTVPGTNKVAISDQNGFFNINTEIGSIIEIEHPFYKKVKSEAGDSVVIYLVSSVINLEEIILKSDPVNDITHSFVVMDDIKKGSQPRNSADLFNDIPGFSIQKRSAMASEPSLRSFRYEQMNIKFDGCTKIINACPNRMDPITSHIIPEEVNKIEIIKGPYSVRFGQTFGGIVNMITKQPVPEDYGFHGNIEGGYEFNGSNIAGRAEILYASEKFDITANGEYRDFGDYTDGSGLIVPSGFNTISYSVKAGINPASNHRLQLDWRQKFGKDILHAGLPMDSPKDNSYSASIDYRINNLSRFINSVTLKSYYSFVDHIMNNYLRPNFVKMDASTPVTSGTTGGKLEFGLSPSERLFFYAGIDLNNEKREGSRTRIIKLKPDGTPFPETSRPVKVDSVWQDASIIDIGFFVEGTYRLAGNFFATAGLRTDMVNAEAKSPASGFKIKYGTGFESSSENTFGGNLSFKYNLKNTQFQLAYGRGTRSASMLERYIYHLAVGADGYEYVGNPFLKAEKNNQIEISVSHKSNRFSFGSSIFYSMIDDYISAVYKDGDNNFKKVFDNPFPFAKQFVNVDAEQIGTEAYLNIMLFKGLEFISNIAFTKADNKTFNEPLAQIAPMTTRLGLKYTNKKLWLDLRSTIASEQDRLAGSFGEKTDTPGYYTLDFRAGYQIMQGLTIGGSVLNILDESYYNHMNYVYSNTKTELTGKKILEPGRNFSFYIKYKF